MWELDGSLGTVGICIRPVLLKCPKTSSCPHMYISSYLSPPHTHSCFLMLIPLAGNRDLSQLIFCSWKGVKSRGSSWGPRVVKPKKDILRSKKLSPSP